MAISLKLAWRNVQRNKRRTLITASAIILGVTMMIFVNGIITGLLDQTIHNSVELETGHIKVYPREYFENADLLPTDLYIGEYREVVDVIHELKDVQTTSPRIKAGGILQTGDDSTRVIINGIDPVHDSRIRHLEKRIIDGGYFTGDNDSLLVGSALAHRIGITVDSEIVLNSIAADGQPVSVQCAVAGIFETGFSSYDSSMVFIPLSQVQSLLKIGVEEVTEIVVMADNPGKISEVVDSMSSLLKERGYDHEVLHWEQLAPQLAQFAEMERSMTYIFLSIVIIVAVIGILNTMLMAVYERIKEVGVMAAFGYKPRNIVSLFLQEGLIIGVIGALAGSILGVGISYYFSVVGITFTGADVVEFMEEQVYPRLSMTDVLFPCIFAVGVALIAALYPAYKASSVEPVEALRHV